MALIVANQISIFIFFTLLSSLHARDSHFFNKIPSTTPQPLIPPKTDVVQDPSFVPDTGNNYGLEPGQLPPSKTSTALPNSKYLPKNYNPVAYVTMPENTNGDTFNNNKYYYDNGEQEVVNNNYPTTATTRQVDAADNNNNYYDNDNGGSSFERQPVADRFQLPQGMSDTRSLDNGKYFYDVSSELNRNEFVDDDVNNNYNFP